MQGKYSAIQSMVVYSTCYSARCGNFEEDDRDDVRESRITNADIENMGRQGLLLDEDDDE